jgi:hypothetical protein
MDRFGNHRPCRANALISSRMSAVRRKRSGIAEVGGFADEKASRASSYLFLAGLVLPSPECRVSGVLSARTCDVIESRCPGRAWALSPALQWVKCASFSSFQLRNKSLAKAGKQTHRSGFVTLAGVTQMDESAQLCDRDRRRSGVVKASQAPAADIVRS